MSVLTILYVCEPRSCLPNFYLTNSFWKLHVPAIWIQKASLDFRLGDQVQILIFLGKTMKSGKRHPDGHYSLCFEKAHTFYIYPI